MKIIPIGKEKFEMKAEKYFCLCEECGSMTWEDSSGHSNTLDEDGDMLEEEDVFVVIQNPPYCHECEKPLRIIPFSRVNKRDRKKIYKMTDNMRIKWVKSFQILEELEDE